MNVRVRVWPIKVIVIVAIASTTGMCCPRALQELDKERGQEKAPEERPRRREKGDGRRDREEEDKTLF